jgi:hypothetical protein
MALPLENLAPVALPGTEKTPGCDCGGARVRAKLG